MVQIYRESSSSIEQDVLDEKKKKTYTVNTMYCNETSMAIPGNKILTINSYARPKSQTKKDQLSEYASYPNDCIKG